MNINPDDAKWTAYVLGELNDAERAEVERELESSTAAREIVEEIRLTTSMLKAELAKEAPVTLKPDQRKAIAATVGAVSDRPGDRRSPLQRILVYASLATAACLVIGTLSIPSLLRSRQAANKSFRVAQSVEPQALPMAPPANFTYSQRKVELQKDEATLYAPSLPPPGPEAGGYGGGIRLENEKLMAPAAALDRADRPFNTEAYDLIKDNDFIRVTQDSLATFSIDVDTASYANMRRFLTQNQLPPKDSVRIEEMINYFSYDYAQPAGQHPIAAYTEVSTAPWKPDHRLVRIGIKGKDVDMSKRPPSNLVFLIDVSGSMESPEKLPLLKSAMKLMIDKLAENDRVAMVVYAGSTGLVLPSTTGDKKEVLLQALDRLSAGGSTNGAAGIQLAYDTAVSNFIKGGINRVILATDGDFNVGVTSQGDLTRLIEDKAKSGVFLSVLGFGMGNYKDSTLEKLADKGDGNYAYIDTLGEARKVLVEELGGTLMTIAKDVKIQIEFNPAQVTAYRLIGYENRILRHEDFNNDQKDAGDMGAGHTVTALFEVVPRGVEISTPTVDSLRYQTAPQLERRAQSGEMLHLKIRYKDPDASPSKLIEIPVTDRGGVFASASLDHRFAAAVASFGMILRDSPHKGSATFQMVTDIAEQSKGADKNGYREEFVKLVRKARSLKELQ